MSVTYQGVELYRQAATLVGEAEQRLFEQLGEASRVNTIDLLHHLATAAEAHPGGG